MNSTPVSRCKAITQWVASQKQPTTAKRIWLAVAPFDDVRLVYAAVCQLVRHGKLEQVGKEGRSVTYRSTANALVDRRFKAEKTPRKSRAAAAPAATGSAHPAATPKPPAPSRAARLEHTAKCSHPPPVDLLKLADSPHYKQQAADLIASDVERFLRAGGRIEKLDSGAVSQPLRLHLREGISIEAAAAIDRKTARRTRAADASLT